MGAAEDIYEEAAQNCEVSETIAPRIRRLIWDAWDLRIVPSGPGISVEAPSRPPYGAIKVLERSNSMLEAQNFAWLSGPCGVAKDVRSIKVAPGAHGIGMDALVQGIRSHLGARATKHGEETVTRKFSETDDKHREVYTSPYDLAGLARIISNNAEDYERWDVYITVGCPGNYIFGPYRVEINTSSGVWRIQSAKTTFDLRMGDGHTEETGELSNCGVESIYEVLRKASYR